MQYTILYTKYMEKSEKDYTNFSNQKKIIINYTYYF